MKISQATIVLFISLAQYQAQAAQFPEGVWTTRGYGYALTTVNDKTVLYEETSISCILDDDKLELPGVSFPTPDTAQFSEPLQLGQYDLVRANEFQGACTDGTSPILGDADYVSNPLVDFDIVAQTFREQYAYFELHKVDWDALVAETRSTLTSNSTQDDLFQALVSLLTPLQDGHVSLSLPEAEFAFLSKPQPIRNQMVQEFENQDVAQDYEDYWVSQYIAILEIVEGYMVEWNGDSDTLLWGRFDGHVEVGYMTLLSMEPDSLFDFSQELDKAFEGLRRTRSMVIDLRLNSGGLDVVSMDILAKLVAQKQQRELAFRKHPRGVDASEATDIFFTPTDDPYQGQVILLVSESTISAAEVLVLAALELDVIIVGQRTHGSFSDALDRQLPNGWTFTLSNEYYLSLNGTNYEGTGIPPHVAATTPAFDLKERQDGVDSWLELALAVALETTSAPTSAPIAPTMAPTSGSTWMHGMLAILASFL